MSLNTKHCLMNESANILKYMQKEAVVPLYYRRVHPKPLLFLDEDMIFITRGWVHHFPPSHSPVKRGGDLCLSSHEKFRLEHFASEHCTAFLGCTHHSSRHWLKGDAVHHLYSSNLVSGRKHSLVEKRASDNKFPSVTSSSFTPNNTIPPTVRR